MLGLKKGASDGSPKCKPTFGADALERLERDDRMRVGDLGNHLDVFGDEMADIDPVIHVELGKDVVIAGRRIDLGRDLPVGKSVRDGVV
jgi:hypothetical protein